MAPCAGRAGPLGVIEDACVRTADDRIAWCGPRAELPALAAHEEVVDCQGGVVLPGLIDCHTHLVHAGSRAHEFRLRAEGKTYQEIARDGGGILSTAGATREAAEDELMRTASGRADEMLARGITTVEIKSGYGLDLATEEKMLRVAQRLGNEHPIDVVTTFLGAHVVPPEYRNRRDEYVALIVREMLPRVAAEKLAVFCDVFVEEGAFTVGEARSIAAAAVQHGMRMKLHADQFRDGDGGALAAELGAISADHMDYTSVRGIEAMAKAGVIAVLLPAAAFFARSGRMASARAMIDAGVRVAVSTDYNPGTSPTTDLLLCATMAVTQMGMTIDEALMGITRHAAAALGLEDDRGAIEAGTRADIVVFSALHEDHLLFNFGTNFARMVVKNGTMVLH